MKSTQTDATSKHSKIFEVHVKLRVIYYGYIKEWSHLMKKEKLIEWVKPYNNDDSHPYYRPFVVQSKDEKYDIFLAGINPATPIYRKDIDLNLYTDLLTDYAEFRSEERSVGDERRCEKCR